MRHLIIVTTWVAIYFGNYALAQSSIAYRGILDGYLWGALVFIPPCAIVGALDDKHLLGVLCAIAGILGALLYSYLDAKFAFV
jgi:hypothetical protein